MNVCRSFLPAANRCHGGWGCAAAAQQVPVRVPLAGEELKAFRDEENRKRRLELEEEEQRRHAAAMEKEQVRIARVGSTMSELGSVFFFFLVAIARFGRCA